MEVLIAIDKFLQIALVRWFLLVSTVALMIAAGMCRASLGLKELQLKSAKGDIATYAAHIELQNISVLKAGQEYEQQKKKALTAQQESAKLRDALKKMGQITIAPNTCDQMVMQAVEELRR